MGAYLHYFGVGTPIAYRMAQPDKLTRRSRRTLEEEATLSYILILVGSLGLILVGAELFTNGIEWAGRLLRLPQSAVGSVLAAVGTALPETLIPIIAIVFGTEADRNQIGLGAILGAPFMLSTLAFPVSGLAVLTYARRRRRSRVIGADPGMLRRDLGFFLIVYSIAIGTAFVPRPGLQPAAAIFLILCYGLYVYRTISARRQGGEGEELRPLNFDPRRRTPRPGRVVLQVVGAVSGIVLGARVFVQGIEHLSLAAGISPFLLAVIVAPIATELPEKFNSVIWLRRGQDTLAMGNITGAMVFQSSVIPAIGMLLMPWVLAPLQFWNAALALGSAALIYALQRFRGRLSAWSLLWGGAFYAAFIALILGHRP